MEIEWINICENTYFPLCRSIATLQWIWNAWRSQINLLEFFARTSIQHRRQIQLNLVKNPSTIDSTPFEHLNQSGPTIEMQLSNGNAEQLSESNTWSLQRFPSEIWDQSVSNLAQICEWIVWFYYKNETRWACAQMNGFCDTISDFGKFHLAAYCVVDDHWRFLTTLRWTHERTTDIQTDTTSPPADSTSFFTSCRIYAAIFRYKRSIITMFSFGFRKLGVFRQTNKDKCQNVLL